MNDIKIIIRDDKRIYGIFTVQPATTEMIKRGDTMIVEFKYDADIGDMPVFGIKKY